MICIVWAALACAFNAWVSPDRNDKILWVSSALGWSAIAVLAYHVG